MGFGGKMVLSIVMEVAPKAGWFILENPRQKWMMNRGRGTTILGKKPPNGCVFWGKHGYGWIDVRSRGMRGAETELRDDQLQNQEGQRGFPRAICIPNPA